MMTGKTPFLTKVSYGLSTALLALSFTFGVSAARAESDTLAPSVEERIANLEATVALLTESFATRQVTAQLLCVSDDAGAQTCVTKAQLDAVLATMARAAAIEPPAAVIEAQAPALVEPAAVDEPAATIIEPKNSALVEPAAVDEPAVTTIEAKAPALVEPAEAIEPAVTATEPKASALVEPAEETIGVASIGVAPAAMAEDIAPLDQEPAHTGAVSLPSSGAALVSHPEVEVSIPAPVPLSE